MDLEKAWSRLNRLITFETHQFSLEKFHKIQKDSFKLENMDQVWKISINFEKQQSS